MNDYDFLCHFGCLGDFASCISVVLHITKQGGLTWTTQGLRVSSHNHTETAFVVVTVDEDMMIEYRLPPVDHGEKQVIGIDFEKLLTVLGWGDKDDELMLGYSTNAATLSVRTIGPSKTMEFQLNLVNLDQKEYNVNQFPTMENHYRLKCGELKTIVKINKLAQSPVRILSEPGEPRQLKLQCGGKVIKNGLVILLEDAESGQLVDTKRSLDIEFSLMVFEYITRLPDTLMLDIQLANQMPMYIKGKVNEITSIQMFMMPGIADSEVEGQK